MQSIQCHTYSLRKDDLENKTKPPDFPGSRIIGDMVPKGKVLLAVLPSPSGQGQRGPFKTKTGFSPPA